MQPLSLEDLLKQKQEEQDAATKVGTLPSTQTLSSLMDSTHHQDANLLCFAA